MTSLSRGKTAPITLKQRAKDFFLKVREVNCPAFPKETIAFNARGLNHLLYKNPRRPRPRERIAVSIRLLPYARELLERMPIFQEEDSYDRHGEIFRFWAFTGIIKNRRIKVVVRQIGNGKKHFYSVIPQWKRTRFGIKNSAGNLAE